jgi:membrane dipeptidase
MVSSLALATAAVFAQTEANTEFEILPRPTAEQEFPEYIEYLVEVAEPRTAEERAADADVKRKFRNAMVIDGLFVGGPGFPAGFSDEQYEEAVQHSIDSQYNVLSATISNGPPEDTPAVVVARMENVNAYWAERPDRYIQVRTVDDMKRAQRDGKLGVFHNHQSMMPLGTDAAQVKANLQKYYDLGLRQLNFTYNIDTIYADGGVSNDDGTDQGVTELGEEVVKEANRLGIVVDCSHSSNQTCIEAAAMTRKPMMMSHSNLMTYQPIGRNVSDQAVRAVGATGGVICVNFIGGFLNPQGLARPYDIAKHVEYIGEMVGRDKLCVGPDYVYNYADTLLWILKNPENFPVEMGYATASHMGKPGEIWGVVRELQDRYGWSDGEIRGFLGENLVRVYEANW